MSKKLLIFSVILLVVTNIIVIYSSYSWSKDSEYYESKIDSLNRVNETLIIENKVLSNTIDSLSLEVNKTDSVIVEIDNWYEKNLDDLVSLPDSGQLLFFTNYLSKNSSRLSSNNN